MEIVEIPVGRVNVKLFRPQDNVVAHFVRHGHFEPESLAEWAALCESGGVVVDAGAYSGIFCISASLLGCERVLAFEPFWVNRRRVIENVVLNNAANIDIRDQALSDTVGSAMLAFNPFVPMTSGASLVGNRSAHHRVPTITIDALRLPKLTAMKLDIERAECLALLGARETLLRCKPSMLVEILGESEMVSVRNALAGIGYSFARRLDRRNYLVRPSE